MALAMEREPTAYRSVLMVAGAVLASPEPMLARLSIATHSTFSLSQTMGGIMAFNSRRCSMHSHETT